MTQMQMHKMFHSRRRNPDGTSFTKKLAAERRVQLAAFVMSALPAETLLDCMSAPRPPSIAELVQLAQQHAAENPLTCPHCKKTFTPGESQ
jgi:hypothetical protein